MFSGKSSAGTNPRIPAFLSIDVEPDGFQLSRTDPPEWAAYHRAIELADWLRSELLRRSDFAPKFGWYYRMDPQIAEVYGSADHIVAKFRDPIDHLRLKGDYFGVHAHPVRWCPQRQSWIHDFADIAWNVRCVKFALDAYENWCGTPAQRFRGGAGFVHNDIVELVDRCGVKVDLTLEPVAPWSSPARLVPSGIDASPYIGGHIDSVSAPQTAYRPSFHDFRVPAPTRERDLILVPMSTRSIPVRQNRLQRLCRRLRRKPAPHQRRMLHLSEKSPSAAAYSDQIADQLKSMRRPYVSVAVRTDAPGSPPVRNALQHFEALLHHPLSKSLVFIDPLDAAATLI